MAGLDHTDHVTHPGDVVTKDKIRMPMWVWIVVGTVVVAGGYWFYKNRQTAAQAASQQAASTSNVPTANGLYQDPTTILPMFQGSSAPVQAITDQQFDTLAQDNPPLPYLLYTVTGNGSYKIPTIGGGTAPAGPVNDQWPAGAAIAALGLSPNDLLNISYYATMITLENLGELSPYPVGTQLRIPYNGPKPSLASSQAAPNMQYLYNPQSATGTSAPSTTTTAPTTS